jgi:hypothetical protein
MTFGLESVILNVQMVVKLIQQNCFAGVLVQKADMYLRFLGLLHNGEGK